MSELLPQDYPTFLQSLKARIRQAQTRAALAVSRELMGLYWQIGRDLRREFPGVERNLERMRAFCLAYPDDATPQKYSGLERTQQVGIYA
jgi:hypothetical protein